MRKLINVLLILSQLLLLISSAELSISRTTKIFPDKHNNLNLTPFLVSLTSEDIFTKVKDVDLICVIDVSGSMKGDRIKLARQSLIALVDLMNENDRIAIIPFASSASSNYFSLTKMKSDNKVKAKAFIDELVASGGTNIYSGLKVGLDLLIDDYHSGERIASMILLSDGKDSSSANSLSKFIQALESKKNIIFTLHTFGYGDEHDAELMNNLSKIRYGGFFFIRKLDMVQEALVEIYGSLSTVNSVDVNLNIQSSFEVVDYNGIEDDFKPNDNTFNIRIFHFVYGKHYNYVILLNIPDNTPKGTIVLNATAFDITKNYYWEDTDDNKAYEAYIKYISVNDFYNSYQKANTSKVAEGINIINNGKQWMQDNYNGKEKWDQEYDKALDYLNYFKTYGRPSLLSIIRELKYLQLGLNYHDENSYQRKLIDDSEEVDINTGITECKNITTEETINVDDNVNYYYFTLEKGIGEVDGMHFSEEKNVILLYKNKGETISIKPISSDFSICYTKEEKRTSPKYEVNLFKGIKFSFEKDFPFEFYTKVDGTKDITFNVQFTNLETKEKEDSTDSPDSDQPEPEDITHNFEVKVYILNENNLDKPTGTEFTGFYDRMHRVGKFVIRQEEISKYLSYNYKNYLYVKVQKNSEYNIEYTKVEGQLSFVSMDYVFADIPEGFYIFSNFSVSDKNPHKYRFKLDKEKGNTTRVEFISSANELSCAIIKYENGYIPGSDIYYKDLDPNYNFEIDRKGNKMGKEYIDIKINETKDIIDYDYLVITIYSKNGGHIAGSEIEKLSYAIRYTTSSNYGIYSFDDTDNKEGGSIVENIDEQPTKKKVIFHQLKSKLESEDDYTEEKTRFFIKLYKIIKQRQKLYRSISLFEYNEPIKTYEKDVNNDNEAFFILDDINPDTNYFYTLFTVSNKNNEILSYESQKIFKDPNTDIDDDTPYQNEVNEEKNITIIIPENSIYTYLMIKISDFDDGKYGILEAHVKDLYYKSVQPATTNYLLIPIEGLNEEKVDIRIQLKDHQKTDYFLTMKYTDNLELYIGEKASIEISEENLKDFSVNLFESGGTKTNIKLIIQSVKGNFVVNELKDPLYKSELFGAQSQFLSTVDTKGIIFNIEAKLGDMVTISSYMVNNNKQKNIDKYEINRYGFLGVEDCISLNEITSYTEKYQVRILGDKSFKIKYNYDNNYDILEPGYLYMKSFTKSLEQICVYRSDNIQENAFYSLQIINTTKQQMTSDILLPIVTENIYSDILEKDEVRYYTQGTFDPNPSDDLEYYYMIKKNKGDIKVYKTQCDKFPNCQYSKEFLDENKIESLNNIDDYFIYSQKAANFDKYDSQNIPVYVVLCLSEECEYNFMIEKSSSFIDLSKMEKYTSKINKNNLAKFYVTPSENDGNITIDLYTHSGELDLYVNEKCDGIEYTIFGNIEKIEIPKSCQIKNNIEIYIQANMDSVYTIEYKNILDKTNSKIKSNVVHMEYIYNTKTIEFSPSKDLYNIKFIPINCEIDVKYKVNQVEKNVPHLQNIYYYNSDSENEKIFEFTITSENGECMIYTYIEDLSDDNYSILSDQIPYYLSLNKNIQNYKLLYPIANASYKPLLKFNFFEETPIKIFYSINGIYADKDGIETFVSKDIIPSKEFLNNCPSDEICYLTIEIKFEQQPNNPIILEIIPKSNNEIPTLLFDNVMRQDFIPLGGEQQYMAKILLNEEGEVNFNYEHFSGEITSNLIKIDKHSWKNRYYLPEQNEQISYDKFKQKLVFTKKETSKCIKGCYLLIEMHNFDNFNSDKSKMDLNMDYTIYLKKNDKIVNIKLNEYITGTLLKKLDNDKYIEYYSVEIPYSTNKVTIDYISENTVVLINDNGVKPTKEEYKYHIISDGKEQILPIENGEDLKNKIFIIGIYTSKLENGISQYSIRIRAENNLYQKFIFANSNTDNICVTQNDNQNCYFIVPITHITKDSEMVFYATSLENSDDLVIYYKTLNLIKEKDDDQYSYSSKDQFIKNLLFVKDELLPQTENENILIKVEVKTKTTINLLYTYNCGLKENLLNSKNKKLYSMNYIGELYLTIPNSLRSLIHFDIIDGKGSIGYENDDESMIQISGKHSSLVIQSTENYINNRIRIKSSETLYFYAYIQLDSQKRNMNEISNGNTIIKTGQGFPVEFYSPITLQDYIINYNINNLKPNPNSKIERINNFRLEAYIIPEETIEQLKDDETFVYCDNIPFIGKYEIGFGISKLELTKEDISKYYDNNKKNYIYIIIQSSVYNPTILKDIQGQITILPKNNNNYPAPEDTYINGVLEKGTKSNEYMLIKKNFNDKKMRIELSANSFDIDYTIFYEDDTKPEYSEEINLGKIILDVDISKNYDFIKFKIIYDEKSTDNAPEDISYTLRYRTDEGSIIFKNYTQDGDVTIEEIKEETNYTTQYKKIKITIPPMKESDTGKNIEGIYYLKIYKRENDTDFSNGTISVIDNLVPYKVYEFKIENKHYIRTLEIPNDKNDYYITITAVTNDKELLSYENGILIEYKEEEDEEDTSDENYDSTDNETTDISDTSDHRDNQCDDCSSFVQEKDNLTIVVIVLAIICFLLILVIVYLICKIRKNQPQEGIDRKEEPTKEGLPLLERK